MLYVSYYNLDNGDLFEFVGDSFGLYRKKEGYFLNIITGQKTNDKDYQGKDVILKEFTLEYC